MRESILCTFLLLCLNVFGQSPYILPGTVTDEIADRWDILYTFENPVFASQRNTSREEMVKRALHLLGDKSTSPLEQWDIAYILKDNNDYAANALEDSKTSGSRLKVYDSTEVFYYYQDSTALDLASLTGKRSKPIFKWFYPTEANFFEVNEANFSLRANPILNLRYGNGLDDPNLIFQNTRGAEIRGWIDSKIYFYTSILENQARFNNYLERRIEKFNTIHGQAFYKDFNSGVIDNLQGYDFLNAQAYVGVNVTKSVAIELGHGKHFIGNGIRSLLISDYATNYFYLKFNTRVWKFHYQNLFTELAPISTKLNRGDVRFPKKYMAQHYLSFKPTDNFEVGIFEAVVFAREDRFEFQYLNPVILYRAAEQFLDSQDNVLIGLNTKWNIRNRMQLYGQLMLDEFKLSELNAGNGWWANKVGLQLGYKYINVAGIDHLDAQVEYNRVRPFTYSHRDSLINFPQFATASYSHHSQPLAHPLGANFQEIVINLRYRPHQTVFINGRFIKAQYGQDPMGQNMGGNILLISGSRQGDFGHTIGQGITTDMVSFGIDISYQVFHNCFLDINFLYRNADAAMDELDLKTTFVGGGLRLNMGSIIYDY